jgi:hypothetical protein
LILPGVPAFFNLSDSHHIGTNPVSVRLIMP